MASKWLPVTALMASSIVAYAPLASATCTYNLTFKNDRSSTIHLTEIHSKLAGGWYVSKWKGDTAINPHAQYTMSIRTDYDCDRDKRFKVDYMYGTSNLSMETTQTQEQNITLSL